MAKYLMDDVPSLLKSEDVNDVEKVLSVVFTSLPTNFTEFIKWVAEVRRQEDGALSKKEKGRLSVKMSSANSCCRSMSSLGDKDTLAEIAAHVCCQGAGILTGNPGSSYGFCCRETCVKRLKANGETPVTMVSGTVVTGGSE
ncbi:Glutathione gamma-glutamylcysteinyltransferase [Thalictrum thalictroides]|uniref:Glutathione gamma-glutamylcysteinyltransferase n=1 Tax=Thalictrum thalictroides TaxID=46969 RepID=A0A7J6VFB5_THATH|nr:Glutathione gamma-glutamylcysteinyltransferase [Thalictrum thalictroides]